MKRKFSQIQVIKSRLTFNDEISSVNVEVHVLWSWNHLAEIQRCQVAVVDVLDDGSFRMWIEDVSSIPFAFEQAKNQLALTETIHESSRDLPEFLLLTMEDNRLASAQRRTSRLLAESSRNIPRSSR